MGRNLKNLLIILFSIMLIAIIAVGCNGEEDLPVETENANESSVQLPAVSSGSSSDDSEDLEPHIKEESDIDEDVYPEPEIESELDLEAYPQPDNEITKEAEAYPQPDSASVNEMDSYPQPETIKENVSAYPEPEVEGNDQEESITLKTEMSASSPSEFEVASGEPQLVEFFAFWCPTCKTMAPIVHALEVEYYPEVKFVYLDIDDPANDEFKRELGYRYQPHFFLLDGEGYVIDQWVGIVEESTLRSALDDISSN